VVGQERAIERLPDMVELSAILLEQARAISWPMALLRYQPTERTGAGVHSANSLEGLIEWNSMAPSSSRERLQSGANAAFSQGEPLGRIDTSGSLATGQTGRRRPATKFNAPVVLQTDRARAKTRKQDTTRRRNRFLPGEGSQLCHR
jgi:hypothetical protein